mmetsp:Transcript_91316/g.197540  ORF Transcript_91316/g.197540 Transcript_91316/m.197540 type:complete len:105 (-) Transcript_91316:276-590(-)
MSNKLKITIKIKKFLPKETKLKMMKRLRLKSKNPIKKLKKREKKMKKKVREKKEVREKTGKEKTEKEKTEKTRVMTRVTKEEMTMAKWTWSSEWEKLGKSPVDL